MWKWSLISMAVCPDICTLMDGSQRPSFRATAAALLLLPEANVSPRPAPDFDLYVFACRALSGTALRPFREMRMRLQTRRRIVFASSALIGYRGEQARRPYSDRLLERLNVAVARGDFFRRALRGADRSREFRRSRNLTRPS